MHTQPETRSDDLAHVQPTMAVKFKDLALLTPFKLLSKDGASSATSIKMGRRSYVNLDDMGLATGGKIKIKKVGTKVVPRADRLMTLATV